GILLIEVLSFPAHFTFYQHLYAKKVRKLFFLIINLQKLYFSPPMLAPFNKAALKICFCLFQQLDIHMRFNNPLEKKLLCFSIATFQIYSPYQSFQSISKN